MINEPTVELAQQLIQLPSTPDSGGEPQVAEVLADRLNDAGFNVSMDRYTASHANVVARWGNRQEPAICLSGHLDTVTVEGDWSVDPFGATVAGSKLYGRGSVDMKTGVAALVTAAERYVAEPPENALPISLVLTAQEEVGSLGASALTRQPELLPDSRFLLIAEPTSNVPVVGHRGAVWIDLVTHGRSCHGSTPHLGENAIDKLVRALHLVRQWEAQNPASHGVLGARTLNIGRVEGGALRNIVPDHANAQLDFRTPLEQDARALAGSLGDLLRDIADVNPVLSLPPVLTDPGDEWMQLTRATVSKHVPIGNEAPVARFFTDASVLTAALGGVPTVICGPGSPDQAHVVDEWCELSEVTMASWIYLDLLYAASKSEAT